MVEEVAHQRALTRSAEAGHPVPNVGEEALSPLLAVVANVDAGLELSRDHRGRGLFHGATELVDVNVFATAATSVQLRKRGRPGEAARMRREDPRLARAHDTSDNGCLAWDGRRGHSHLHERTDLRADRATMPGWSPSSRCKNEILPTHHRAARSPHGHPGRGSRTLGRRAEAPAGGANLRPGAIRTTTTGPALIEAFA